mmetsp:Transcript_33541/g.117579  ORF Transcript_33541/g.117579 Transcript_33541/m.117579 type:complete len:450 (+) Transcript_33541:174-1523(+)
MERISAADAKNELRARGKKARWPCMMPSPTKVTPLSSCRTAPMTAGARAASRTAATGVKTPSNGSAASWSMASTAPSAAPQPSMRSATASAGCAPPPAESGALIVAGTRIAATADMAKSTTPPSCHVCMAMVCAAAASPEMACVARATARRAQFSDSDRASTPRPPARSGASDAADGGRHVARPPMMPFFASRTPYAAAAATSATPVATAAPRTPMPSAKMQIGSSTALIDCVASVTRSGVATSRRPRNVAKPTKASIAGTSASARTKRYSVARPRVAADAVAGSTARSACAGQPATASVAQAPMTADTKAASWTRCLSTAASPAALADATSGVTTDGKKLTTTKMLWKTWFAAPSAASACKRVSRRVSRRFCGTKGGRRADGRRCAAGFAPPWTRFGRPRTCRRCRRAAARKGWPPRAAPAAECACRARRRAARSPAPPPRPRRRVAR